VEIINKAIYIILEEVLLMIRLKIKGERILGWRMGGKRMGMRKRRMSMSLKLSFDMLVYLIF
jgi:hypothetical protein